MTKILGVGIATLDIINYVDHFPEEDSEVRATKQNITRGGNVSNTLTVLSQLGHQCYWAGTLASEADSSRIVDELEKYSINTDYCRIHQHGKVPTSYITLNTSNGSRSIIHYRDLPELDFDAFRKIPLAQFDWIHFEARNIPETVKMLNYLKSVYPDIPCSIEYEKKRDEIEQLFPFADVSIFSRVFCEQSATPEPDQFINKFDSNFPGKTLILGWGDKGSYGRAGKETIFSTAVSVSELVDTLGAGDTFNAGVLDALINKQPLVQVLSSANKLAAFKISRHGFDITGYEK